MKTKLLIAIVLLAISAGNVGAQFFVPQTGTQTFNTCGGIFYDSQLDPGVNYTINQNGQLIICPAVTGQFSGATFTSMALMDNGDMLRIYSGSGTTGPLLQTFQGPLNTTSFCGSVVSQDMLGGCLTFQFITNVTGVAAGWVGNLFCSPTPSTVAAGINCANPVVIVSLPYSALSHTTCCSLNDYQTQSGICNTTYAGEDKVYRYDTTGPESVCITISNATGIPTLAIYQGCPGAGGVCLTPTPMVSNNTMQFTFPFAGTYYIIVDEQAGCVNYDLNIVTCTIGIDETNSNNTFSISPNPSSGKFTIDNSKGVSELVITNILGEKIYKQIIDSGKTEIDLSNQPEGIYFVQVKNDAKTIARKVVIQK